MMRFMLYELRNLVSGYLHFGELEYIRAESMVVSLKVFPLYSSGRTEVHHDASANLLGRLPT